MKHARWAQAFTAQELGEQIRSARKTKGLRQDELAERLGVTRMTVSRLEKGEGVSIETAMRALSECGYAVLVAPKFARIEVHDRG